MNLDLPQELRKILCSGPGLGRSYLVGGCVRDALLGESALSDFDIEVFGMGYETLASVLGRFGRVDVVGRSFGVVKLTVGGAVHDFSIPRRDSKTAAGHRGFEVELDPDIQPRDAAARRDFTINALMLDPRSGELLDFFGGAQDLSRRVLRHTSDAFAEDPLRVLRGMQFAGRFDLEAAPETLKLCRGIAHSCRELPGDRIREEWFKWASKSRKPSAGLRFLEASGWIGNFPEIAAMRGTPQDPEWHPEGDVLAHTGHVLDAMVDLPDWRSADAETRIVLSLAGLAHDIGKATCTCPAEQDGRTRIVSPGHEAESARLAEVLFARMDVPKAIVARILPLVGNHMAHFNEVSDRALRRLARRLHPETVARLCVLMTADASGRPPLPRRVPDSVRQVRETAERLALHDAAPRPVLMGRHLLTLGFEPGPEIGRWISAAFEAQLDGAFTDVLQAHAWLAAQVDLPEPIRARASEVAATVR